MTKKQFGVVAVLVILSGLLGGLASSIFLRRSLPDLQEGTKTIVAALDTSKSQAHGCYVSYDETCLDGFTKQGELGTWGTCCNGISVFGGGASGGGIACFIRPPNKRCGDQDSYDWGKAVVCCK